MIRLLAAVCVIIGAWGIGYSRSVTLKGRCRRIAACQDALLEIATNIRSLRMDLPDALAAAAAFDPLFGMAASYIEQIDATAAFIQAIAKSRLPEEEQEILTSFAKGLFAPDVEGPLQNVENCRLRLANLLQKAEKEQRRMGRVYSGVGAMGGLALVVLFL